VKSENRRCLAFTLVNKLIPANGEASGQWARQGSNLRPTTYEEAALTTELRALWVGSVPVEMWRRRLCHTSVRPCPYGLSGEGRRAGTGARVARAGNDAYGDCHRLGRGKKFGVVVGAGRRVRATATPKRAPLSPPRCTRVRGRRRMVLSCVLTAAGYWSCSSVLDFGFFNVEEKRLRVRLYLHQDLDLEEASSFWSGVTGIPCTQFCKPYRAVPDPSIRTAKHVRGCATVRYSCSATHRAVMGLVHALFVAPRDPG
jgi:hypothetical protein